MIDQALLTAVQFAVVEPPDGGQLWPSGLWTRDEVLGYLNQRQDRFLKQTQIRVTVTTIPIVAGVHLFDLPDDWMRTLSVVWRGDDGVVRELPRSEPFELDHILTTWETTDVATPLVYTEYDPPNRRIQIAPAPTGTGTLELLYLGTGTALTGAGVALVIPDECASPGLKYGVLADLLGKDGRGKDAARAQYCEDRYRLGIEVTQLLMKGGA